MTGSETMVIDGKLFKVDHDNRSISLINTGECTHICGQPSAVYVEVAMERVKQEIKWGEQNHHPMTWLSILGEEYGESCKAANESNQIFGKENWEEYRKELIQVAAVAIAMIESLDRNTPK